MSAASTSLPTLNTANQPTAAAALDTGFRCAALEPLQLEAELESLRRDCTLAFALDGSNWLGATAEPRCALERLARAVYDLHVADLDGFDPATSGAEWWAQVRTGGNRQEGIEFHWDCDEFAADAHGVHVHPNLSTVLYLSDVGAPTLVLDAPSPRSPAAAVVAETCYGPVGGGAISWPRLGKLFCFDGSKLHGAVPPSAGGAVGASGAPAGERRVTFLVNVWLGHQPRGIEALPAALAASMSQGWAADARGAWRGPPTAPTARTVRGGTAAAATATGGGEGGGEGGDPALQTLHVAFGRTSKEHALHALLPPRPAARNEGPADDTLRLLFASDPPDATTGGPGCSASLGPNDGAAGRLRAEASGPVAVGEGRSDEQRPKKRRKKPTREPMRDHTA